jgi:ribosome-associated heat shock protein Hsp15
VSDRVRVDKWLWAARFFKTRGLAREAVKGGKVQIDGHKVKPGHTLKEGDELTVRRGEEEFGITVTDLGDRRVSAALVKEKYQEHPESKARREAAAEQRRLDYQARRDRARRPDKRQRRQIVRFTRGDKT